MKKKIEKTKKPKSTNNKKFDFQNMKLAQKTAIQIGSLLVLSFTLFVAIILLIVKSALIQSIDSEFNNMSEKNAVKIQAPFDTAAFVAADLQMYLEAAVERYQITPPSSTLKTEMLPSAVLPNASLEILNKEAEDYVISTVKSAVKNNEDINNVSVMFEPYGFDEDLKEYSININADDIEKVSSYSAYSEYSKELYYAVAKETKKPYFTPPIEYDGETIICATYPILYQGEVKGVIAADINVKSFAKIVTQDQRYKTMFQDIVTDDLTIVYDSTTPNGEYVGVNFGETMTEEAKAYALSEFEKGEAFQMSDKNTKGQIVERYFYPIRAGIDTWWVLTGVNKADKETAITTVMIWMILLSLAAVAGTIVSIVVTIRKLIKPITKVVDAAGKISTGDLEVTLEAQTGDEIGILSNAFNATIIGLKSVIGDISYVLNEMAKGNLDVETKVPYPGNFKEMQISVNSIVKNLNEVMANIKESSMQVSSGSGQIATGAQSLAEGATEQASTIEELQATVTDITSQVERNAENAKEANAMAQIAGRELRAGNEQMKKMLVAMEEINQASLKIKNVIQTIEDIAGQTNLLSLNASIEAARAGDAGRGFAVVADQVGKLAAESAEATKITTALIASSMQAVENGIAIANETAMTIDASVGKVEEVVTNVEKISAASDSQANALDQITQGVEQIASVIEENSAMAEESASASEELSAQAQELDAMVSKFNLK